MARLGPRLHSPVAVTEPPPHAADPTPAAPLPGSAADPDPPAPESTASARPSRAQRRFARLGIVAATLGLGVPAGVSLLSLWTLLVALIAKDATRRAQVSVSDHPAAIWLALLGGAALAALLRRRRGDAQGSPRTVLDILIMATPVVDGTAIVLVRAAEAKLAVIPVEFAGASIALAVVHAVLLFALFVFNAGMAVCRKLDRAASSPFRAGIVGAALLMAPAAGSVAFFTTLTGLLGFAAVAPEIPELAAALEEARRSRADAPSRTRASVLTTPFEDVAAFGLGESDDRRYACFEALAAAPPSPTERERAETWLRLRRSLAAAEAQDIAAAALLAVCTTRPHAEHLPSYYMKSVRRRADNKTWRRWRRETCPIDDGLACRLLSPEDAAIEASDVELAHRLRCRLDDEGRTIVDRHIYDGETFERIGRELGKTANAVKKKYRRALDQMRQDLETHRESCGIR